MYYDVAMGSEPIELDGIADGVTPRRTVQLLHTLCDGSSHVDWMIDSGRGAKRPLVTFRLAGRLDELQMGERMAAERIDDHRATYLDYEGPVSGDRGSVRRLSTGVALLGSTTEGLVAVVAWSDGPGAGGSASGPHSVYSVESAGAGRFVITQTGDEAPFRSE